MDQKASKNNSHCNAKKPGSGVIAKITRTLSWTNKKKHEKHQEHNADVSLLNGNDDQPVKIYGGRIQRIVRSLNSTLNSKTEDVGKHNHEWEHFLPIDKDHYAYLKIEHDCPAKKTTGETCDFGVAFGIRSAAETRWAHRAISIKDEVGKPLANLFANEYTEASLDSAGGQLWLKAVPHADPPLVIEVQYYVLSVDPKDLLELRAVSARDQHLLDSAPTDFILKVDGNELKVHKLIVGASSETFRKLFHEDGEKGVMEITDASYETVSAFVEFCYKQSVPGEFLEDPEKLFALLLVANKQRVKDLQHICINRLIYFMYEASLNTVWEILRYCDASGSFEKLFDACAARLAMFPQDGEFWNAAKKFMDDGGNRQHVVCRALRKVNEMAPIAE